MLLNNCATSINNNLEQSISNNYSSFDQALSVNKLFYAENKDKNELKVDRELILEALKYEFSDTKELNTLITLSQSDNLRPYGKKVIQDLIKNNIEYTVIPGPSSVINALILSGMPSDSFTFKGFFPRKNKSQIEIIDFLKRTNDTVIFFESAKRISSTINFLSKNLSQDRSIALCREMTKQFEETLRGSIKDIKEKLKNDEIVLKGEFVIVVDGTNNKPYDIIFDNKTRELYLKSLPPKDAAKLIATITNQNKREIYNWLIDK